VEGSAAEHLQVDIVIIGGGVAGLWLLNRLGSKNYNTILLECGELGCEQTIKSQGIIHGGVKYALDGTYGKAADSIAKMPSRWRKCIEGKGEIDLKAIKILSEHQYLWSTHKLPSYLADFFANKIFRGRVEPVPSIEYPTVFQSPNFKDSLYRLNEIVLDVPSVINELVKPHNNRIYKVDWRKNARMQVDKNGEILHIKLKSSSKPVVCLRAQRYVFAAGIGNKSLLHEMSKKGPTMQRRPLHMVWVKHRYNADLFAHCVGPSSKPRVTITSYRLQDGSIVWYLGGDIAESGVKRDTSTQIQAAKKELQTILPWVTLQGAQWYTFNIERAEPAQRFRKRPDTAFAKAVKNSIVAWPTKMALSPILADEIIQLLNKAKIEPLHPEFFMLEGFYPPNAAKPVWEDIP